MISTAITPTTVSLRRALRIERQTFHDSRREMEDASCGGTGRGNPLGRVAPAIFGTGIVARGIRRRACPVGTFDSGALTPEEAGNRRRQRAAARRDGGVRPYYACDVRRRHA